MIERWTRLFRGPLLIQQYQAGSFLGLAERNTVREIAMVARRAHMDLKSRGRVEIKIPRDKDSSLVLSGPGLMAMKEAAGGAQPILTSSDARERSRLLMALDEAGDNRNAAAKALGVGRSTLYRRMVKFGIPTRRT